MCAALSSRVLLSTSSVQITFTIKARTLFLCNALEKQSTERLWTLKNICDTSCNSFLSDSWYYARGQNYMCVEIFVSLNSKSLTPDFLYILAFEVKTETAPPFSNWIKWIKNHTNKYKIEEKFGYSSHSIFALVITFGPESEEQFYPLLLMLLFFSV